jgi:drug/metabolite transporter (DMT)-like permease
VTRGYVPLLVLLASLWGASYFLIKVAVDEIEPSAMMTLRLFIAAAVLIAILVAQSGWTRALADVRGVGWRGVFLGFLNAALPFWLIAWGEKHIDSGVAAIANSTVPIFVALLAIRLRPSERASGVRLAGILIGLLGVGVLTGVHPEGGWWAVAGTLAVVLSSVFYATGSIYGELRVGGTSGPVLAAGSMVASTLLLVAPAALQPPASAPGWKAVGALLALAVAGTAFAQLLLFRLLRLYGARRTSLVTYVMPGFALLYGAVFLDEPVGVASLGGLALILSGVALGSGAVAPSGGAAAGAPARGR